MKRYTAGPDDASQRLDRFIAAKSGCARTEATRLIHSGLVRVDGKRGKKGQILKAGARVELLARPAIKPEDFWPVPQPELPLLTVHEDRAVLGLVKPMGMPSHPLEPGERGTLANALVARFPECAAASEDPREGGLCHRLDRDTSGVILAARSVEDWRKLRKAFSDGEVAKQYWALAIGSPPPRGRIDVPLKQGGKLVKPIPGGGDGALPAVTEFSKVAERNGVALLAVTTFTGRMHQIRAHLAHIGHPLVGDVLYGGWADLQGHFLHAASIRFPHPRSGKGIEVTAPLPDERANTLKHLLNWSED
jgi:23S rRNA pseudouridine1911/1915/1917 synthase